MNYCDQCGQRLPICVICKEPLSAERVRRHAITCSKECFTVWRKDRRIERKAVAQLKADLAAIRAAREAGNTVPDSGRATVADEFKQAIEILSGE